MSNALREWAEKTGYRVAWFGGKVIRSGFDRIRRLKEDGAIDSEFFEKFLSWMAEPGVEARAETKTLVLVAIPRPAHVLTFEDQGRTRDLILPPTYVRYSPLFDEVLRDLTQFTGDRLKLRLLSAPLKTLAGLTGFARYGKNNITYVDPFGSAIQLAGFATETPLKDCFPPPNGAPASLDECGTCRACLRACPSGAIVEDRFLLHGDRCLVGFTETEGPLPEAFGRLRTPTLIGCLACQECCPANRGLLRFERLPCVVSSEETAYLVGERGNGPPAPELAAKIQALGFSDLRVSAAGPTPVFRRNLRAALRTCLQA